jgi:hypothetical protein
MEQLLTVFSVLFAALSSCAAVPPTIGNDEIHYVANIPTRPLRGGGHIPMMMMGGTNHSGWFKLAGKGAAIQTFLGYGNGPKLAPEIAAAGRENVFVSTGFYCGGIDNPQPPMNASAASALIDKELAELETPYADLLMMHHRCQSDDLIQQVWSAMEAAKAAGKAKHLVRQLCSDA